jgi:hypothetical protein
MYHDINPGSFGSGQPNMAESNPNRPRGADITRPSTYRSYDFNVGESSTPTNQGFGRSIPSAQHNRWDTSIQYNPHLNGFGVPELSNLMEPMDTDALMGLVQPGHFSSAVMNQIEGGG